MALERREPTLPGAALRPLSSRERGSSGDFVSNHDRGAFFDHGMLSARLSTRDSAPKLARVLTEIDVGRLEQIPKELVVDLVMVLNFLCLDKCSELPWTAVSRSLLQCRVTLFDICA